MLKWLNSSLGDSLKHKFASLFRLVWSYVPLVDKDGQPTGYCRISCRIRLISVSFCTAEVAENITEKLCKELNS